MKSAISLCSHEMQSDSLRKLIDETLEMGLIDAHSIDQDGSNVIVVGETIRYLTDEETQRHLDRLIVQASRRKMGSRDGQNRA